MRAHADRGVLHGAKTSECQIHPLHYKKKSYCKNDWNGQSFSSWLLAKVSKGRTSLPTIAHNREERGSTAAGCGTDHMLLA